ncbi:MAG TPA: M15 family metallopeptidase [Acidimicrobiales bacterium]|nr:M15 family metallopeptidase [Acidimicrobiales bacterium]
MTPPYRLVAPLVALMAWAATCAPPACLPPAPPRAGFVWEVSAISAERADAMVSWRPGCPVPYQDLRAVRVSHHGFDGADLEGELVIHADAVDDLESVFRRLWDERFPVERIRPVDEYGGSDDASMAANNTSAFNCRAVTGGTRWSEHAYGRAVDINPVQNPYVSSRGTVLPPAGAAHLDRSAVTPGLIREGDAVVAAFDAVGWGWGGRWTTIKDYQHFSANGR